MFSRIINAFGSWFLAFGLWLLASNAVRAQQFDKYFHDGTLRLDYTLTGDFRSQQIALDRISRIPKWHGRRGRLKELPVRGNSQMTVRDHLTGDTIYRNSCSTLFQEWLAYPEAKQLAKSFEHVCLMPMPKAPVDVTIELRNNRNEVSAVYTHTVNPEDILIRRIGEQNVTPYETLQKALPQPSPKGRETSTSGEALGASINIAFLAEGYQESEMDTFIYYAREAMEAIFAHEPFKSARDRFNIIAVKSPSKDSGTSEPGNGIWRNTALGSHFNTFYADRYLTTLQLKTMHDWLAGTPYEHIIVLVNTEKYGGGGILNFYNLSMTKNKFFRPVVVHEFGHSFAGLADEYAYEGDDNDMYPLDIEPWEPNITTKVDFASKWQDMISTKNKEQSTDSIGLYEGAGYRMKGVYRPTEDCRMRTNQTPDFCPVCQRALKKVIDFYTSE